MRFDLSAEHRVIFRPLILGENRPLNSRGSSEKIVVVSLYGPFLFFLTLNARACVCFMETDIGKCRRARSAAIDVSLEIERGEL